MGVSEDQRAAVNDCTSKESLEIAIIGTAPPGWQQPQASTLKFGRVNPAPVTTKRATASKLIT